MKKVLIVFTVFLTFIFIFVLSIQRPSKFPKGTLRMSQNERSLEISIEIADNDELWTLGLMYRKKLPWKFGMLFIFPQNIDLGFWMKNTYVPLDIAFINSDGEIFNIQRMEPCKAENCPIYKSPQPYKYALEVRAGFFEKFGFSEGAKIEFRRK